VAVTVLNAHPTLLHAVLLTVPAVNIVGSPCTLIVNDATGNASAYDADGTATAAAIAGRMNHAKFGSSPKSVIEGEVSFMQRLAWEVVSVNPRFI
jgi:hypothetical protein